MTFNQTTDAVTVKPLGFMAELRVSATLTHRNRRTIHEKHETFKHWFEHLTEEPAARAMCLEQARQWASYENLKGYDVVATDSAGNTYP